MEEKPKRRFWQIHLSTAVMFSLIAAGILGANVVPSVFTGRYIDNDSSEKQYTVKRYGWPIPLLAYNVERSEVELHDIFSSNRSYELWPGCGILYSLWTIILNLLAWLAMLAVPALLLNLFWRTRQR
jgi:hypothetical protein